MKKAEKILGLVFLTAIILKIFNFPGHSILASISLLFLAVIYFYLGFAIFNDIPLKKIFKKISYSEISKWRIIGTIGLGIGLSTMIVGIMFKLLHYPGSKENMIFGLFITSLVFAIVIFKFLKTKISFYMGLLIRIAIVGGFGILMLLTSDLTIEKIQYRNNPEYVIALEKYHQDPNNKQNAIEYKVEKHRLKYGDEELNYYLKNNTDYLNQIMTKEEIEYYTKKYTK